MKKNLRRSGFSLVEVVIALAITAFCLVSITAMLPVGVTTLHSNLDETAAAGIATSIAADLRETPPPPSNPNATPPPAQPVSPRFQIAIPYGAGVSNAATPATLYFYEDGTSSSTLTNSPQGLPPRYVATIYLSNPTQAKGATIANILITWPAQTEAQIQNHSYVGSYEVATALDRN